ncbi:MAG: type IV pilin protein [Vicinamibacterales bacterium]
MRALGIVVGLVLALGVGYYVLQQSANSLPGGGSPMEQIDTTAIRQRLLAIGQTERQWAATHDKYATLEQLSEDNLLPGGTEQRGYTFSAVVNGNTGFTITAAPTDENKSEWPTLEITESMTVTEK